MPIKILHDDKGNTYTTCVMCDKLLEEAMPGGFKTRQPYAGGEMQLLFGYGSTKFDDAMGGTVFAGMICDDCAEKLVKKMDRLTPNHRENPPPTPEGLEEFFPILKSMEYVGLDSQNDDIGYVGNEKEWHPISENLDDKVSDAMQFPETD